LKGWKLLFNILADSLGLTGMARTLLHRNGIDTPVAWSVLGKRFEVFEFSDPGSMIISSFTVPSQIKVK
jgi:hypothetical protein